MHMFPGQFRALPVTSAILCCKCDQRADYAIIADGVDDYYCTPHKRAESRHLPALPLCRDCERPIRISAGEPPLCCQCRRQQPVVRPALAVTRYDEGEDDGYLD